MNGLIYDSEGREIFDSIFSDVDGYKIHFYARLKSPQFLVYGELTFDGLSAIYAKIADKIGSKKSFYDLGSGIGKVVLASSILLPNTDKLVGVELLPDVCDASNAAKERLSKVDPQDAAKIKFVNSDIFDVDYGDADIIFLHYPFFNHEDSYLRLEDKMASELKSGAIIITVIRKLKNLKSFPLISETAALAGYGSVGVYCHEKL